MDVCFVSTGNVILTATRSRRNSASCVCSLGPSSILVAGASLFSWGSVLRSDSLPGPLLQGPAHRVEQVAYVDSKVTTEDTVEPDVSRSKHTLSARDLVRWGIATKAIAGGTLTTIALSILGLYIIQDRLVYWPSSLNKGNPGRFGMDFENVNVVTSDKVAITGWFIKNGQDTSRVPTVIYFHGTDKNASFRLRKAAELYRAVECNILLISYRGYGESMGRPSEKGMCTDAETNMTYIRSRTDIDQKNIWVYGESLGGAVALYFTEKFESEIRGLILENTFTSLIDMIKYVHPLLDPLRLLSRNKWLSLKRVGCLRLPLLFLSGEEDEFVPPNMMSELFEASASQQKKLVRFPGGTHNNTWRIEGFFQSVADFINCNGDISTNSEPRPQTMTKLT